MLDVAELGRPHRVRGTTCSSRRERRGHGRAELAAGRNSGGMQRLREWIAFPKTTPIDGPG